MTNQEAIASLRTLCNTCKLFPRCAYKKPECFQAIELAISALQEKDSLIARLKAEAIKRNVQYMKSGDRYLIGFVDGMRLARSIVDGSIDEPKYVYPSEGMSDD